LDTPRLLNTDDGMGQLISSTNNFIIWLLASVWSEKRFDTEYATTSGSCDLLFHASTAAPKYGVSQVGNADCG
jgi:hypothetical protein